MSYLLLDDKFPDLEAQTTDGDISLHDYLGNSWGILCSHPGRFTPVCTTEIAQMVKLFNEFNKRNVKLLAISMDSKENCLQWIKDINAFLGRDPEKPLPFPIIADENRFIAKKLGMVKPEAKTASGLQLTARQVFIISPENKLKLMIVYPATTGRCFSEILRAVDSLQTTEKYGVATEADWMPGDRVIVPETFPPSEAKKHFPKGVQIEKLPSCKKYLQFAELAN